MYKSAPGAKWTYLAPLTLGKIDTPETIDLPGYSNTPRTINYSRLNAFIIIGWAKLDSPVIIRTWGKMDPLRTIDLGQTGCTLNN